MLAIFNTNAAASSGVIGWCIVDFIRYRAKFSSVGACEGAVAGLVGITPAAGLVSPWLAVCIGFIASVICSLCRDFNEWIRIDEGLDVFKLHGIGGMVGAFLTGIFASAHESMLDGQTDQPGGIDGNGVQVGRQFAHICSISGYSFVLTIILLIPFKFLPGWMNIRVNEDAEEIGLDSALLIESQIGDWNIMSPYNGTVTSGFDQHYNQPLQASSEAITVDASGTDKEKKANGNGEDISHSYGI